MTAVVVNSLVREARSYSVSVWAGIGSVVFAVRVAYLELRPYALSMICAPRWRTSATPPGKTLRWMSLSIAAAIAAARAGGVATVGTAVGIGVGTSVGCAVGAWVGTGAGRTVGTGAGV